MHVAPWINTKRQEQLLLLDIFQQMFVPVCRHWPVGIMCTCPPRDDTDRWEQRKAARLALSSCFLIITFFLLSVYRYRAMGGAGLCARRPPQ